MSVRHIATRHSDPVNFVRIRYNKQTDNTAQRFSPPWMSALSGGQVHLESFPGLNLEMKELRVGNR